MYTLESLQSTAQSNGSHFQALVNSSTSTSWTKYSNTQHNIQVLQLLRKAVLLCCQRFHRFLCRRQALLECFLFSRCRLNLQRQKCQRNEKGWAWYDRVVLPLDKKKNHHRDSRLEERCSRCDIMLDQARSAQGKRDPRLSATFALR